MNFENNKRKEIFFNILSLPKDEFEGALINFFKDIDNAKQINSYVWQGLLKLAQKGASNKLKLLLTFTNHLSSFLPVPRAGIEDMMSIIVIQAIKSSNRKFVEDFFCGQLQEEIMASDLKKRAEFIHMKDFKHPNSAAMLLNPNDTQFAPTKDFIIEAARQKNMALFDIVYDWSKLNHVVPRNSLDLLVASIESQDVQCIKHIEQKAQISYHNFLAPDFSLLVQTAMNGGKEVLGYFLEKLQHHVDEAAQHDINKKDFLHEALREFICAMDYEAYMVMKEKIKSQAVPVIFTKLINFAHPEEKDLKIYVAEVLENPKNFVDLYTGYFIHPYAQERPDLIVQLLEIYFQEVMSQNKIENTQKIVEKLIPALHTAGMKKHSTSFSSHLMDVFIESYEEIKQQLSPVETA